MNKSKIEWCDMTWNPVTGCLHNCEYCYARGIAYRFAFRNLDCITTIRGEQCNVSGTKEISYRGTCKSPFPFGFSPTFHRYRLDEPVKRKKPTTYFVGSMTDLFADYVPDEWIAEVFKACKVAPQHRYLFLTKNGLGYGKVKIPYGMHNWYLGQSWDNEDTELHDLTAYCWNPFISIEPLQDGNTPLKQICDGWFNWVIIGAETGNRKDKIIPKRKWITDIVDACRAANIPVFLKNNLADIWQEPLIQEYPWEV